MNTAWRLLNFLKPFLGWVGLSFLLGTATFAAGIGLVGVSADLIARAALLPGIAALQLAIVGVRFFGISKGILRYLERLTSHSVNLKLLAHLRTWLYRKLEPLAPARFSLYRTGDLLARLMGDIEALDPFYIRGIAPPLTAVLVSGGVAWFFSITSPDLAMWYAGMTVMAGIVIPGLFLWAVKGPGQRLVDSRSELSGQINAILQGREDILAFGQEEKVLQAANEILAKFSRVDLQHGILQALGNVSVQAVSYLALVGVLVISSSEIVKGSLNPVVLAVFVVITLAGFEAVNPLPATAQHLSTSLKAASRVFNLADEGPAVQDPSIPHALGKVSPIKIDQITFTYDPALPPALHKFSMELLPGKWIALVGPSGGGKSTLISLLLRFWEFQQGTIAVNGVDIRSVEAEKVRALFAVIPQSAYIFTASLRQNLWLSKPGADDARLVKALTAAGLGGWFSRLPDGLDTWLGSQGVGLSAGERQRVAIARAVLGDAPYLLLDEPVANLDARTAWAVMQTLRNDFAERGVLLITHWLTGLEEMDQILVVDRGNTLERGTHTQLIQLGGWYARAFAAQRQMLD